jgi:Transposase IS116/IS110/IS902 family
VRIAHRDRALLHQVDLLNTIDGVDTQTIIAEIDADMSGFSGSAHLVSWAANSPSNNKTAGNSKPGHIRPTTDGSNPPSARPRTAPSARRTVRRTQHPECRAAVHTSGVDF